MSVEFANIHLEMQYSRPQLAEMWGYESSHALHKGVVTPRDDNKLVLFITEQKKDCQYPYLDRLVGHHFVWEAPKDHSVDRRMDDSNNTDDEIHVFYREHFTEDFTYKGLAEVVDQKPSDGETPASYILRLVTCTSSSMSAM